MYAFHGFACGIHAFHRIVVDHDPQAGNPFRKSLVTRPILFQKQEPCFPNRKAVFFVLQSKHFDMANPCNMRRFIEKCLPKPTRKHRTSIADRGP